MTRADQLELWRRSPVAPARTRHVGLAKRLPDRVYLGTSSWAFPGWTGIVWERPAAREQLARHGLAAYAAHPLLRCVGVDRYYYAPPDVSELAAYAEQVPTQFRFVVKAPEACCWLRFPSHARFGALAGDANPHALEPGFASERFVRPCIDGLGDRLGALVFQLPPQHGALSPGEFAERLARFLEGLPAGPLYAVEIRTRSWLTSAFADALDAGSAVPCLTVHPAMPDLTTQARIARLAERKALVARWNLGHGRGYEAARERYAPFDELVEEDPANRALLAELCRHFAAAGRPAYVTVNNKAEGSAPISVAKLAAEIVGPR